MRGLFSSVSDDFDDDEKSFKMSEIVQFVGIQNLKLRNLQPKGKNNICKKSFKKTSSVEPDWQKLLLEVFLLIVYTFLQIFYSSIF